MWHMWQEREKKKNDGGCLCQGLMRRVMPWIGRSTGSPWFLLVQSGLVMCDVDRLSLAGHYSAPSRRTLPPMSARSVCVTPSESHMHAWHRHDRTSFISLHSFSPPLASTHSSASLSIAGAHIQANEKWQLCTLFAIQHLSRPPVSKEEGELHSLTPMSPPLFNSLLLHFLHWFVSFSMILKTF